LEAAVKTIANAPTSCPPPVPLDAEYALIARIFHQALLDLNAHTTDPYAHAAALRWWRNQGGELAWWCTLAGLDTAQVQAQIARRYPEVLVPRQLEMDLGVAS
jgi:hypothetical protein